ncbi:unnamed protein product [Meloidogyne enterolobii]|uniref:Uncharacterized protein n=1 Tax=Meloidogyne enterolobii TaxID=390850 RepID=A0ACB1AR37_MELEN
MGIEAKRAAMSRKKSPPIFSHEFIIQNHGDIISCVIMFIMLGFMFNATTSLAQVFIVPQYNDTLTLPNETESRILYRNGVRDLFTIFFYTLVWIAVHCALQEYIFDKVQRRLHLSKTRQVKFNESGHTAVFSIYSICHAISILNEMEIHKDLTRIWTGYPELHRHFSLSTKLYYIFQISFWLHQIPEFYFQKLKREEIFNRLVYLTIFITASCFFYFAKFKPWNFVFLITRLVSIVLGVIALWYGHRQSEVVFIDFEAGNFNTKIIRINSLIAIVLIQLWMLFNFSTFHIGRWREKGREQAAHSAGKKKSSGFGFKNKKAAKTSSGSDVSFFRVRIFGEWTLGSLGIGHSYE